MTPVHGRVPAEEAFRAATASDPRRPDLSIYLVTDTAQCAARGATVADTVAAAVAGGVTIVQVRDKDAGARDVLALTRAVCAALPRPVPLVINDRLDVALAARDEGLPVTGVHVGQSDLPADAVRRLLGPDALLGVSANTLDQQEAAHQAGADYVGVGPLRPTSTKPTAPTPLGFEGLADAVDHSPLPVVAIGGITPADLARLRADGLAGAAVVSAVCAAPDPGVAAGDLVRAWGGSR